MTLDEERLAAKRIPDRPLVLFDGDCGFTRGEVILLQKNKIISSHELSGLGRDELDEKALLGLQGIVRVSHTVLNGHSFLNFDGFAPAADWKSLLLQQARNLAMAYSYSQIAQYLRCPRSYRYRYFEGRKEKDSRPTLLFGRSLEQALGAYFRNEDSTAALFSEWTRYREAQLEYSHGDSWERTLRHGVQLLERLAQDDRVEICRPSRNMQIKLVRSLPNFVAYIDAIGKLDGNRCLCIQKNPMVARAFRFGIALKNHAKHYDPQRLSATQVEPQN